MLAAFLLSTEAGAVDSPATPASPASTSRDLPVPRLRAAHHSRDFEPAEVLANSHALWSNAAVQWLDKNTRDGSGRPELATAVRAAWTDNHLYLFYAAPYTQLTTFEPATPDVERIGLWERDVVEAFIAPDPANLKRYDEFQVAPNAMKLDLRLRLPERDFAWDSGMKVAVAIDAEAHVWRAVMRIPLRSLSDAPPKTGTQWRIGLFRCDTASKAFLAWRPSLNPSFHVPERFGVLEFVGP